MSTASSQQPCPRCQFPLDLGVSVCPQCGLSLPGNAAPSADLLPLSQPLPGGAEGTPAFAEPFAGAGAASSPTDWSAPGQPPFSGIFPPPASPQAPMQVNQRRGRKIALIALAVALVIVLSAGGSLAYILTRPKPVIQVKSDYHVGAVPVGSVGTSFHLTGQQFSGNASISFLLDGQTAPGTQAARSDGNGNVQADLTVTSAWTVGRHTLTARDDQNYVTKGSVPVEIVARGVAGTPGPNGAPADNASFTLAITFQTQDTQTGEQLSFQDTLSITGQPNPAGGTVCRERDDGQPHTYTGGSLSGTSLTFTQTVTFTCKGSYQSGKLTYTEILNSMRVDLSNRDTCAAANVSIPYEQFDGTFSSSTAISGAFTRSGVIIPCQSGMMTIEFFSEKGTWTGTR